MKYAKPEIVKIASALQSVQAGGKGVITPGDSSRPTNNAYEADE